MTTKYDVGDIVLLPFRVNFIKAYSKDSAYYSVSPVGDDPRTGVISENQIVGVPDEKQEAALRDCSGYYD